MNEMSRNVLINGQQAECHVTLRRQHLRRLAYAPPPRRRHVVNIIKKKK